MLMAQSSSPPQASETVVDVDVSVPSDESEREDSGYVPRSSVVLMPDGNLASLQLYDGWMDDRPGKRPLFDTFSERGDDEIQLDAPATFGRVRIERRIIPGRSRYCRGFGPVCDPSLFRKRRS